MFNFSFAEDEDGGVEEEINERVVALKDRLANLMNTGTKKEVLLALSDLNHELDDGPFPFDPDLAAILDELQRCTYDEVYNAAKSIMERSPFGVEGKITCYPAILYRLI